MDDQPETYPENTQIEPREESSRIYVDENGVLLGIFGDGAEPPEGAIEVLELPLPSHETQRQTAFVRVDQEHAGFLRNLTGNATIEERDTWKTKEDAARALVAGSATDGQQAMIAYEAQGDGTKPLALAQTIIAKAEAFQSLIGLAAGMKAKAKTAITQASSDQVPIEQVASALEQVFGQISAETNVAVAQWKGQSVDS
jgi:hypothetical protein